MLTTSVEGLMSFLILFKRYILVHWKYCVSAHRGRSVSPFTFAELRFILKVGGSLH